MESQHESRSSVVWISKFDPLPTTCCDCGSFTDNRVVVKHVDLVSQSGKPSEGCTMVMLMLVVHVALGPIGWLISAMMHGDEEEEATKTVKRKSKVKIPQCRLCHGMQPPRVLESRMTAFAFQVHPKFKQGVEQMRNSENVD